MRCVYEMVGVIYVGYVCLWSVAYGVRACDYVCVLTPLCR